MKISVIGTGYVGLVSGVCFTQMGNSVICVDINEKKIKNLKQGIIPIYEPGLEELTLQNYKNQTLHFTTIVVDKSTIQAELDKRGLDIKFDVVSNPEFLKEGAAINDFMHPDRVVVGADVNQVRNGIGSDNRIGYSFIYPGCGFGEKLDGKTFAVWGLNFKPEADDMREASAITIINELTSRGAKVIAYDPKARDEKIA